MRGEYGFDAPAVPLMLGAGALALLVPGLLTASVWPIIGGLLLGTSAASFVYATRRGKVALWRALLADLHLQGDERILDVGCGRGAVLVLAALGVPAGTVVGVDLWRTVDQSGNSEAMTATNARREGVSDRIELHTADMTALPFEAASFDVVLSSLAIHNVKPAARRRVAIDEAARVLKPGGRIVVADIKATEEYAQRLRELGMAEVATHGLGWRGWYGGPWMATRALRASKPLG